jgi:hypothetical protein
MRKVRKKAPLVFAKVFGTTEKAYDFLTSEGFSYHALASMKFRSALSDSAKNKIYQKISGLTDEDFLWRDE